MRAICLSIAATFAVASNAAGQPTQDELAPHPVRFAPNESGYSRLGPVGPYYPERAAARSVSGEAVIDCYVGLGGGLDRCVLVSEAPVRHDFGVAALRMAQRRWVSADPSQVRVGEKARFVVPFQLPDRAKAPR